MSNVSFKNEVKFEYSRDTHTFVCLKCTSKISVFFNSISNKWYFV